MIARLFIAMTFSALVACKPDATAPAPAKEAPETVATEPQASTLGSTIAQQEAEPVEVVPPPTASAEAKSELPYREIQEGAKLGFRPVSIAGMPPVKTETDHWGKTSADDMIFAEDLFPRLEKTIGRALEKVQIFNGGQKPSFAFVYRKDEVVHAVQFDGDENLGAWLTALADTFDGSSTHSVRPNGMNGMGFSGWDRLATDPRTLAIEHAPSSYKTEEHAAEKAAYFRFDAVRPVVEADTDRLETAYAKLLKMRAMKSSKPAAGTRLDRLEKKVGAPLPGDLHALYTKTGGIEDLFFDFDLMSPTEIDEQWTMWKGIFDSWTLDDLQSHKTAEAGIHPVYVSPRWVPFIDLVNGHYLAVDLGPAPGGTYGQVILFGRDVDNNRRIASSVTELLEIAATYDGSKDHALYNVFGELRY